MSMPHRLQIETSFANRNFGLLPKHLPGRVNTDDFVFFQVPDSFPKNAYSVVIQTTDTSNPGSNLRNLGDYANQVELPFIHFGSDLDIYLMPKTSSSLPTYRGRLNRGSTYIVPARTNGHHGNVVEMRRTGMLTAGV